MPSNDLVDNVQNVGVIAAFVAGVYAWVKGAIKMIKRSRDRAIKKFNDEVKGSNVISNIERTLEQPLESNMRLADEIIKHMAKEQEDRNELRAALKNLSDRLDMHLTHHH